MRLPGTRMSRVGMGLPRVRRGAIHPRAAASTAEREHRVAPSPRRATSLPRARPGDHLLDGEVAVGAPARRRRLRRARSRRAVPLAGGGLGGAAGGSGVAAGGGLVRGVPVPGAFPTACCRARRRRPVGGAFAGGACCFGAVAREAAAAAVGNGTDAASAASLPAGDGVGGRSKGWNCAYVGGVLACLHGFDTCSYAGVKQETQCKHIQ